MFKDQYIYPAVIMKANDQFTITFLDFPDTQVKAKTVEDGFAQAKEALAHVLFDYEERKENPPTPSELSAFEKGDPDQFVTLIDTWMPPFRKKMENQAVKKTLTIPKWLDDAAKEAGLNYSRILQDALKEELNIDESGNSFSVQDRLNNQLKKVKKSLKDLSKIRVHVNRASDDASEKKETSVKESLKQDIDLIKQELNEVADRLKNSNEYQQLNEKINRLIDKLNR
ncbi:type II toxin-antitoxin system HicB family antitoxin [Sporolactobacillus terrae]|uniref:HicB family protein n=1 Tax=Sporolactobacillus terrae TaxID=269673 RepID=A0ABX5Q785_9BACL|nr:type II toxin-antitoxin system HicB family antitoxin [Sporolactobacillus terrae]QAA22486.1 HicB family protein [Sporolactobacillus terrae]QAA25460.1 HicB family protein [Sporolactobacillus terrae]UAK17270.1 type II toxin-antitoxin system HicB family antitoxin [Sporolactobacillus terrae]